MNFVNVGAGWIKKEEGKKTRVSVKLENGMFLSIFKNEKKQEGSNQPDYNLTMDYDSAEKLGLLSDRDKQDSINPENIPF